MADKVKITLPEKVELNDPTSLISFADTLAKFIVNQKLYTDIKGKNYVNVEGWQFAGGVIGVMPVVTKVEQVPVENEIKYRAEVKLVRTANGRVVGNGVAICSNKELGRAKQDEYVIASMAQTRATGKAYRNAFAWLMKMAGYEATPAEEVTSEQGNPSMLEPVVQEAITAATTADELSSIFNELNPEEKKAATPLIAAKTKELRDKNATKNG